MFPNLSPVKKWYGVLAFIRGFTIKAIFYMECIYPYTVNPLYTLTYICLFMHLSGEKIKWQ